MMQFAATVPDNTQPGQTIRIRCQRRQDDKDSKIEVMVNVPKGLKAGDSFMFEVPAETSASKSSVGRIDGIRGKLENLRRQYEELVLAIAVGYVFSWFFFVDIVYSSLQLQSILPPFSSFIHCLFFKQLGWSLEFR